MSPLARIWVAIGAALGLCAASTSAEEALPRLEPTAGPLALAGTFGFTSSKKDPEKRAKHIADQRRAASGIACARPGLCLIAFDEGVSARFAKLTRDTYEPWGDPVALPVSGDEADAEGVTFDAAYYYVVGSHATKRNSGDINPASRLLGRLKIAADGSVEAAAETADLWAVIGETELAPYRDKALGTLPLKNGKLGERGLDIEGIASDDTRLYFGLRGPSGPTAAKILSVDKAIFTDGKAADPRIVDVEVGEKRAIRDLHEVEGGFLLLAGPDDDASDDNLATWPTWRLLLWDGRSATAVPQGEFAISAVTPRTFDGCADKTKDGELAAKLEGFAVVEDRADGWTIVTVFDGLCDGGPMWFDVKRRP